jgi:hypothetical protein
MAPTSAAPPKSATGCSGVAQPASKAHAAKALPAWNRFVVI